MSELLSEAAAPGPDPDSEMPLEPSTLSEEPLLCDTETQVVPERKKCSYPDYSKDQNLWYVRICIGGCSTDFIVNVYSTSRCKLSSTATYS